MSATFSNCHELLNNALGQARTERVNGREFLVAPLTLIVPGVLHGSKGPLYYPPEEVARNIEAWNGMPLVVLHPTRNGIPVSGRDPRVMGESEIGRVYNARIGTGGRLQAEGWFDVEATERADHTKSIVPRLRKGQPIELSTGLFTDNVVKPGTFGSKVYSHIATNYRPDHLAILPDRKGACSTEDGCGVLVNERGIQDADDDEGICQNCRAPLHPGPCKGFKRGLTTTKVATTKAKPVNPVLKATSNPIKKVAPVKSQPAKAATKSQLGKPTAASVVSDYNKAATMSALDMAKAKARVDALSPKEARQAYNAMGFRGERSGADAKKRIKAMMDSRRGATLRSSMTKLPDKAKQILNALKPSTELKKEGMTAEKACKIMEDGKANGVKLSKKQKGMFGALCGQREETKNQIQRDQVDTTPVLAPSLSSLISRVALNCGGPGSGVPGPCPGPNSKRGTGGTGGGRKPIVGKAFSEKSSPQAKSTAAKSAPAKTAPAKTTSTAKAAPAKPKTVVKVSAAVMKAAKKLHDAREAAKKRGDAEGAAKANAKLKRIVDKAKKDEKARSKGDSSHKARKEALLSRRARAQADRAQRKGEAAKSKEADAKTKQKEGFEAAKKARHERQAGESRRGASRAEVAKARQAERKEAQKERAERKATEKGKTTEAKGGGRERSAGKVTEAKAKAAAKIAEAGAKAAVSGDSAKANKAKAKLEKIAKKAGVKLEPQKTEAKSSGGRERKRGKVTQEKVKAVAKYQKAIEKATAEAKSAAARGDSAGVKAAGKKLDKINSKMNKLVKRATNNEALYTKEPFLVDNEVQLVHNGTPGILVQACNAALFLASYHRTEIDLIDHVITNGGTYADYEQDTITANQEWETLVQEAREQIEQEDAEAERVANEGSCRCGPTTNCEGKKKCDACAAKSMKKAMRGEVYNTDKTALNPAHIINRMMKKVPDEEVYNKGMKASNLKKRCKMKQDGTMDCPDGVNMTEPHKMMDSTVIQGPQRVENDDSSATEEATDPTTNDGCVEKCTAACKKAMKDSGDALAATAPGGAKVKTPGAAGDKPSHFENCDRDEKGRCKKGTGSGLPNDEESGAAGGKYISVKNMLTKVMSNNANPSQARGEKGKWAEADRAALYHAVRKVTHPEPLQAMPEKAGQGAETSDEEQDAEAAEAHSPASVMAANVGAVVRNVFCKTGKKGGVDPTCGRKALGSRWGGVSSKPRIKGFGSKTGARSKWGGINIGGKVNRPGM